MISMGCRRQSQLTTDLLRTAFTRVINELKTNLLKLLKMTSKDCRNIGHKQQQSFKGLHSPGRSIKNKSSKTAEDDLHRLSKHQSQPTTVLLRTAFTRTISQLQTFQNRWLSKELALYCYSIRLYCS